ncbi:PREDICTED: IQ domain-containing protein G [Dipodomys ordii]|uniref:IQ domain-containing protein G n=1 Tax=Dipodomys ordii TaxID=10020 RepID=A0A1S3FE64_DIPOR|nr:PREDICTED: IQ domain-containing protein G [Dipodomys ordii]
MKQQHEGASHAGSGRKAATRPQGPVVRGTSACAGPEIAFTSPGRRTGIARRQRGARTPSASHPFHPVTPLPETHGNHCLASSTIARKTRLRNHLRTETALSKRTLAISCPASFNFNLEQVAFGREEKGKKQIKSLQKQVMNVKKERQAEVQSRNEYISHLKDQLQEMKAKTNMENQYMKKNTELQISQTQRKCNKTEELLMEEIEKLRMKTEEENRTHMEIEVFLRKEQQKLEEKLEYWMEKFDKDTEMKQNELTALQTAKATDLAHLQELAKMLQAWWRGTVVRREIGTFRLPKKEKDDVKDVKGKGKGKDKDKRKGKK